MTALWFLYDEDAIKLSLNTSRQKVKNLQAHPECTFFVFDPASPYRTMEVRARAEIEPDPDYTFANRLAAKYGGVDLKANDKPGESRIIVSLKPVRVNTWGG